MHIYINDVALNLGYKLCEDLNVGLKQLNAGGDCFTIHFEKMNWYEARMQCKQRGHDLATIRHEQQREELANKIWMKFRIFKLYHFWIGFRNSDWLFHNSGGNNITIICKIEAKYKAAFVIAVGAPFDGHRQKGFHPKVKMCSSCHGVF